MKKAVVVLLLPFCLPAIPQKTPQPIKTCHTLIGELLHADVTSASYSDLGDVRKLLTACVADHEDELTKQDLIGVFLVVQLMDNELSARMKNEVDATKAAILQAKAECEARGK
jgi:hypothetical protein